MQVHLLTYRESPNSCNKKGMLKDGGNSNCATVLKSGDFLFPGGQGPPGEITLTAWRPLRDLYARRSRNLSTHLHLLS